MIVAPLDHKDVFAALVDDVVDNVLVFALVFDEDLGAGALGADDSAVQDVLT